MIDFIDLFSSTSSSGGLLFLIKSVLLIAEFLYGAFAFVVFRQVGLMNSTFQTDYGSYFKFIALLHFLTVVAVFILTLILL